MSLFVRAAVDADLAQIRALLAPEIAAGAVLPREVKAEDFLVACQGETLLGVVALSAWSDTVAELGALVSGAPGQGVGRALVAACAQRAEAAGFSSLVALTGTPSFFQHLGFEALSMAPHHLARKEATLLRAHSLGPAMENKARLCAACSRLSACQQVLLHTPLQAQREAQRAQACA